MICLKGCSGSIRILDLPPANKKCPQAPEKPADKPGITVGAGTFIYRV